MKRPESNGNGDKHVISIQNDSWINFSNKLVTMTHGLQIPASAYYIRPQWKCDFLMSMRMMLTNAIVTMWKDRTSKNIKDEHGKEHIEKYKIENHSNISEEISDDVKYCATTLIKVSGKPEIVTQYAISSMDVPFWRETQRCWRRPERRWASNFERWEWIGDQRHDRKRFEQSWGRKSSKHHFMKTRNNNQSTCPTALSAMTNEDQSQITAIAISNIKPLQDSSFQAHRRACMFSSVGPTQ